MLVRYRIDIQGIVQGVGFRPFVFNLAKHFGLAGWVKNHSVGVTIEAEGEKNSLDNFVEQIRDHHPVLAQIIEIKISEIVPREANEFLIQKSENRKGHLTLISPDICTCKDCLKELLDPVNRRYRYPFINCTNCGPRFTIICDIPYDRPKTTMAEFALCEQCQSEYDNPVDRRFHAQPNACPVCGPQLFLTDNSGNPVSGDPIRRTVEFLEAGKIVAIKGLGGFHLAIDARQEDSVRKLRQRKRRYEKPLALMSESVEKIKLFAWVNEREKKILESSRRPICLLRKKRPSPIAGSISPDNDYLGVMLPYTPLHFLIMHEGGFLALVMTSGNMSEEPIVYENRTALKRLAEIADYFLLNNRDIHQPADDSVVRQIHNSISHIRRSRGFVPLPILTKRKYPSVLAVGGELKNSICLNKENYFFLSQHIGDLENLETLEFFEQAIRHLQRILEIEPRAIACDLHPDYLSTRWAREQNNLPVISVQHHHAHIAACMAEKELTGEVIGFSLDGTGFGTDGNIWGGEILLANEHNFRRLAHFRQVPLPGGEKAIREPWRMLVSYNHSTGIDFPYEHLFPDISCSEKKLVDQMITRSINSPLTSSCGRLFDAVAASCGLRYKVGYEGQAAMQLEALINSTEKRLSEFYPFEIVRTEGVDVIDWKQMFLELKNDLDNNLAKSLVSRKFHNGLVEVFLRLAHKYRKELEINRVVLSGGCFQNRFLTEGLAGALIKNKFNVYYHTLVPPNDGGLSLGQAYIVANKIKAGEI